MINLVIVLGVLACAHAMEADDHMLNDLFAQYIAKYGKSYATDEEWNHRKNLFKESHREINKINSNGSTHTAKHNLFSDWTHDEYRRLLGTWDKNKLVSNGGYKVTLKAPMLLSTETLPESVDWRTKGGVTNVKN